jgi:hypothetical protein
MSRPLALLHYTTPQNIKSILDSRVLYTTYDLSLLGKKNLGLSVETFKTSDEACSVEYPGVFFIGLFPFLLDTKNTYPQKNINIILVFCNELLQRGDFHFNFDDQGGSIDENTLFSDEFETESKDESKFINLLKNNQLDNPWIHEFVFHNSVPLTFLREIWVYDDLTKTAVEELVLKSGINLGSGTNIKVVNKQPKTLRESVDDKDLFDEKKMLQRLACDSMPDTKKLVPNKCYCVDENEIRIFNDDPKYTNKMKQLMEACAKVKNELDDENDESLEILNRELEKETFKNIDEENLKIINQALKKKTHQRILKSKKINVPESYDDKHISWTKRI